MAAAAGSTAQRFMMPELADLSARPDRRRLIAAPPSDHGPFVGEPLLGRITTFSHGGFANPVINRSLGHSRHKSISKKTGYTHVGEGRGEQWLEMTNEVDGNVVAFLSHPYRLDIDMDSSIFSYRPDSVAQYLDDTIKVIEVKRTPKDIDDDLAIKLALVREFLRRIGWEFEVMFEKDILGSRTRQHNLMRLYGRRATALSERQSGVAAVARRSGKPITLGDLAELVSPESSLVGTAAAQTLIAQGHFLVDLDMPIVPSTILTPTPNHDGRSLLHLAETIT